MKKVLCVFALLSVSLGVQASISLGVQANDNIKSQTLKEEDKVFKAVMGPVSFADAYGSRKKGPHGTFGKFPANFETPEHTHSHGYRAVVLKGNMTNPFMNEQNPAVMKPGSFWSVKAGAKHSTACVSSIPCEFFMYSHKPFDFVETKKK